MEWVHVPYRLRAYQPWDRLPIRIRLHLTQGLCSIIMHKMAPFQIHVTAKTSLMTLIIIPSGQPRIPWAISQKAKEKENNRQQNQKLQLRNSLRANSCNHQARKLSIIHLLKFRLPPPPHLKLQPPPPRNQKDPGKMS